MIAPASVSVLATCSDLGWCEGMRLALAGVPHNHAGKGLHIASGWLEADAVKVRPRPLGIVYRERAGSDGLLVNFCPWCGARVALDDQGALRVGVEAGGTF